MQALRDLAEIFPLERFLKYPQWLDQSDRPPFSAWVIVITGGPCSGKTTFLKMAKSYLEKYGFLVIIVPEAARELIAAGFHPAQTQTSWKYDFAFQELVLRTQLEREAHYARNLQALTEINRSVVFLCDRGVLDGEAYVGTEKFRTLLANHGLEYSQLLDRYSAVIMLDTAAKGAVDFYKQDEERFEDVELARDLNEKTNRAWLQHTHMSVIDNSTDFATKMNRALLALRRTIHMPIATEIERKYVVKGLAQHQVDPSWKSFEIVQTYLLRPDRPGMECRVRMKSVGGAHSFFYTEKSKTETEGVRGEFEESIDRARYDELLTAFKHPDLKPIQKTRYKFGKGSYVYELDFYYGSLDGLVTLEVELPDEESLRTFKPDFEYELVDVTKAKRYSNYALAKHGIPASA